MHSTLDNYECPICLQLIVEPVTLACKHMYCLTCLESLEDFSATEFKCPMCRKVYKTSIDLKVDLTLQNFIKQTNINKFNERMNIIKVEKEDKAKNLKVKLIYGNRHHPVNNGTQNSHKWTLYVDIERKGQVAQFFQNAADLIESVEYRLHETFKPPIVTVYKYPFELSRIGWGVFEIPITITFKQVYNMPPLKVKHYLSFDDNGEVQVHLLPFQHFQKAGKQNSDKPVQLA